MARSHRVIRRLLAWVCSVPQTCCTPPDKETPPDTSLHVNSRDCNHWANQECKHYMGLGLLFFFFGVFLFFSFASSQQKRAVQCTMWAPSPHRPGSLPRDLGTPIRCVTFVLESRTCRCSSARENSLHLYWEKIPNNLTPGFFCLVLSFHLSWVKKTSPGKWQWLLERDQVFLTRTHKHLETCSAHTQNLA